MSTTTRRIALAVLALGATALAGCGDDDSGGGASDTPDALALGTPSTVDFFASDTSEEVQGSGTVTITAVREGAISDLTDAGYNLDDEELATTPYYVDIAFQYDGEGTAVLRTPSGEDQNGDLLHPLIMMNFGGGPGFEPCPGVPDTIAAGQSATGCSVVLVPEGRQLEQISYYPGAGAGFIYWDAGID